MEIKRNLFYFYVFHDLTCLPERRLSSDVMDAEDEKMGSFITKHQILKSAFVEAQKCKLVVGTCNEVSTGIFYMSTNFVIDLTGD